MSKTDHPYKKGTHTTERRGGLDIYGEPLSYRAVRRQGRRELRSVLVDLADEQPATTSVVTMRMLDEAYAMHEEFLDYEAAVEDALLEAEHEAAMAEIERAEALEQERYDRAMGYEHDGMIPGPLSLDEAYEVFGGEDFIIEGQVAREPRARKADRDEWTVARLARAWDCESADMIRALCTGGEYVTSASAKVPMHTVVRKQAVVEQILAQPSRKPGIRKGDTLRMCLAKEAQGLTPRGRNAHVLRPRPPVPVLSVPRPGAPRLPGANPFTGEFSPAPRPGNRPMPQRVGPNPFVTKPEPCTTDGTIHDHEHPLHVCQQDEPLADWERELLEIPTESLSSDEALEALRRKLTNS